MVRKIILTRDDSAERVLEAISLSKESALTVVAPRGSALADREGLSRIGDLAAEKGIAVAIESVDEELLSLAHAAHLETVHPFFRADKRHLSLDGIVKSENKLTSRHPGYASPHKTEKAEVDEAEDRPVAVHHDDDDSAEPIAPHNHPLPTPVSSRPSFESEEPVRTERPTPKQGRRVSWVRVAVAGLVALALVVGIGEGFFRRGTVSVTLAETPWEYSATVVAATSVTTSTPGGLSIPGQLFQSDKNVAQSFPATGEPGASSTPSAAKPRVTVFNESLEAETFVVKTRFQGKSGIFRAATAVAIPAAKKDGDKLVAGSATVEVTPDSAAVLSGAADGERLSVPGLAGSAKADLFYATLAKPAAPSATPAQSTTPPSERIVTEADAEGATSQINEVLANSFKASLIASQPEGLTIIDGAIQVEQKQLTVNREVDAQGNFNLVGQAVLRGLAFREDDLRALLLTKAAEEKGISYPAEFRNSEITYTNVQPDLGNGRLSFTVTVKGTIVGKTSEDLIRSEATGKGRSEVATWITEQKMFEEGSVSVSPFWRFDIPEDTTQVRVRIK